MIAIGAGDAKTTDAPNPFIGLRPFDIDDADRFFGRNTQTYELLRRLQSLHFVAVLGPSGCGKSSLIRAGVLAALRNGYLTEEGDWTIAILEPGADPLRSWTRHLTPFLHAGHTPDELLTDPAGALDTTRGPLVILVDQFEDLFRYGARLNRPAEVEQFVHAMLATGRHPRIYLMLTMRSEYLPQCANHADLAGAINEGIYLVPRMDRDQMKQAIVGQVRAGGAAITTELVDKLLDDAMREDDSLPVLQHALTQIWPKRQRWEPLGLDLYPKSGGLATFVDQHAEAVYASLPTDGLRSTAESLFRAITEMTADGRAVRRPLPFDEIVKQTGQPADRLMTVIDAFRREGFVTVKEEASRTIDIAHEAVARQWMRLGQFYHVPGDRKSRLENVQFRVEGWMVEEARKRRAIADVRNATEEWLRSDRDKTYLFRGMRLRRLMSDLAGYGTFTTPDRKEFFKAPPGVRLRKIMTDLTPRASFTPEQEEFLNASVGIDRWDRALSIQNVARVLMVVVIVAASFSIARQVQRLRTEASNARIAEAQENKRADSLAQLASTSDAERLKAETAYRQAKESAAPSTSPPAAPDAVPAKARLYTQIWNDDQRREIQPIVAKLPSADIDVARFETVTIGPNHDELRYFRTADTTEAQRIAALISENGLKLRLSYVPGFESSTRIRARHYELWLAAPPRTVAQAPPSTAPPTVNAPGTAAPPTVASSPQPAPPPPPITAAAPPANAPDTAVQQTLDPTLQVPQIDAITATASESTAREPARLSLRIVGRWIDADAQLRIDDKPIDRSRVVVSVLAPSSSAKFATDITFTITGLALAAAPPSPHKVLLFSPAGRSASAFFVVGQTLGAGKAYRR